MARLSRWSFRDAILPLALIGFLVVTALGGGSSRADVQAHLFVRLAAVALGAAAVLLLRRDDIARLRIPFVLLAGLTVLMALQLVPLPPSIWTALPGRAFFVEAATSAGLAQPWRPLSLTPDLTLDNLAALLPVWAMLLALAVAPRRTIDRLVPVMIAIAVASALLGILQLAGGLASPFYTYSVTSPGDPVGLFANRNHQALLLASALPLTMVWAVHGTGSGDWPTARIRAFIGAAIVMLFVLVLIVSGSRSGFGLMALGLVAGLIMIRGTLAKAGIARDRRWIAVALLAGAVFVGALIVTSRADTLSRLFDGDTVEELRVVNLPLTLALAWRYFPAGAGFGSFDPMFRIVEPDAALTMRYYNNAHNDLVELAITGGVPALLLLAGFLLWWIRTSVGVWQPAAGSDRADVALARSDVALARSGSVVVGLFLLASLVDYPLRTPLGSVLFVIAVVWLAGSGRPRFTKP